jgi:DNA-binding NarL/FixJ family response regulator
VHAKSEREAPVPRRVWPTKQHRHTAHPHNRGISQILEGNIETFFAMDRDWRFSYLISEAERISDRSRKDPLNKEQLLSQREVIEAVRYVSRTRSEAREAQLMVAKLTPRERDVLQALAEGLSDKEIAERLYVGIGTVRSHTTSLLSKLEVRSRLQALVFAVRHGLVEIAQH